MRPADAVRVLREGSLQVLGRLADASNVSLYCRAALASPEQAAEADPAPVDFAASHPRAARPTPPEPTPAVVEVACIYKPVRGERPLWDFPDGTLANREYAAYLVSEAAGWGIVPTTVLRDGPFGPGMVQRWVETDGSAELVELVGRYDRRLRRIALFDAVINNADRKAGHLLPTPDGDVHGVDHGVSFAAEPKLRTVLWGWRGSPLTGPERTRLQVLRRALDGELSLQLLTLLTEEELNATRRRVDQLLSTGRFPEPDPERPSIPWPPF